MKFEVRDRHVGRKIFRCLLLACTSGLFCSVACAQTSPDGEASLTAGNSDAAPEGDIVVTATRRQEAVTKVPTSVTAFGSAQLKTLGATNLETVLNLVPSVVFVGDNGYRSSLTVRGVQGSNEDAAVAMYLDGVYVGRDVAQNIPLVDADSVQILRGPQGALYGKNTLGGAIIVKSRQPSFTTQLDASLKIQNYGYFGGWATVTGPISSDRVAALVTVFSSADAGNFYNTTLKRHVNDQQRAGGRVAVTAELSDTLKLDLAGDYTYDGSKVDNIKAAGVYNLAITPEQLGDTRINNRISASTQGGGHREIYGTQATLTWSGAPFTATSVTAYRGYNLVNNRDFDGTGAPYYNFRIEQHQHQFSQELTLISPGRERFNWLAGVQYFSDRFSSRITGTDRVGSLLFSAPQTPPVDFAALMPRYDTDSYGAYVQGDFEVLRGLKAAAGVRYSYDKRAFSKDDRTFVNNGTPFTTVVTGGKNHWEGWLPEASLTYELTPDVSIYGKYAGSYRPGGYNVNFTGSTANEFKKETSQSYEGGLKWSLMGGRFSGSLTGYRIIWKDQQLTAIGAIGFLTANGDSKSKGVEFDSHVRLTDELTLDGGVAWLKATFGRSLFSVRNPITRVASTINVEGQPLLRAPEWSGSLGVTYNQRDTGNGGITAHADLAYVGDQYLIIGRPDLEAPSIVRLNGRLGYRTKSWEAILFGTNLLNRYTLYFAQSSAKFDTIGITAPRRFGVEFRFHYR